MSQLNYKYENAYSLFNDGKYEDALDILIEIENENFSEQESEDFNLEDVYILMGTIALNVNEGELAVQAFEKALENNSTSVEATLGMGQALYSSKRPQDAKVMFEWVAENNPDNEVAKNAIRILDEEIEDIQLLDEDDKSFEEIHNLYDDAFEEFINNNYSDSLNKVKKMEDLFNVELNILKGNILLGQKKFDEAKKAFKLVLEIDKSCSTAYNGMAKIFIEQELFEDAKLMYEYAININNNDQYALLGLAEVNKQLKHSPVNSHNGFFGTLELTEEEQEYLNTAYKLFENKEYIKSINKLNEFIENLKGSRFENSKEMIASLRNFKGYNYLALSELQEAKEMFENALELNPESSQACTGLGEIAFLENDDETAKAMFEWGVINNPKNFVAINGLAKVNKELGFSETHNTLNISDKLNSEFGNFIEEAYSSYNSKEYNKALELLFDAEKFIDLDSDDDTMIKSYCSIENFKGFCYLSLDQIDKARDCFERSLSKNSQSSQACAGLGEIFYLEQKDDAAKEMFEWALRNEPGNKFAKAGLEKLLNTEYELVSEENLSDSEAGSDTVVIAKKISDLISDAYDYFNDRKFNSAIENLKEAEKLVEENFSPEESYETLSSINNFLGFNYLTLGKNDDAKSCYEKSLENNPESSQASAGLGELLFQDGEDEAAKQMFEFAVKYNPNNKYAENGLAKVNKLLGHQPDHNTLLN